MEEKGNKASLRPEEWGGQRFIYEEDEESCYYYDKECIEEKERNQKGNENQEGEKNQKREENPIKRWSLLEGRNKGGIKKLK